MKPYFLKVMAVLAAASILSFAASNPQVIRIGYAGVGSGNRPVGGGAYENTEAEWGSLDREFKADGIEIKRIYFSGAGPAVNEALANNQLDFAWQGDLPGLVGRAGGLPTKLILAATRFDAIYIGVPSSSHVQSLDELKGKRVAVFKGTNLQLAFYKLLASKGYKDTDFKILNMSTADGDAALLSGDIDALVTGADLFPLVDRGVARILYDTKGHPQDSRLSHLLVTESFSAKYPQLVQRVVNQSLKAAAWTSEESNRTKSYQIWVKSGFGLSAWTGDHDWCPEILRSSPLFDTFYRDQYKRLLAVAVQLKLVRHPFDIDKWLDARYLNQGLKDLKLEHFWPEQDTEGKPVH
jgi:sulfonate transport system substrate-binding protein